LLALSHLESFGHPDHVVAPLIEEDEEPLARHLD